MFSDEELGDALAEQCAGKRSVGELGSLVNALRSRLMYPLDRLLEQHAPESLEVPTGNMIRLDYSANQPPVLAVRLQELFGWTETPTVAGGRVRVRLHLLGPNYRPVQVTDDLRNFWATTYFQVRKDLRARYPKHSWAGRAGERLKPERGGGGGHKIRRTFRLSTLQMINAQQSSRSFMTLDEFVSECCRSLLLRRGYRRCWRDCG